MTTTADRIFSVGETHARVLRPGNRLIAHSQEVGWRSLHAAIFEEAPFRAVEAPIHNVSFIYHLSHPTEVTRRIDGARPEHTLIHPRRICITPGDVTTEWQHAGHPEILQVYVRQSLYERAIGELYGCDATTAPILPRFAILDPLLEQLAIALTNALRDGTSGDGLYVDTIAQMIAVHLARTHSTRSRPAQGSATPMLVGRRLRRLFDFIDANLDHDLSLDTLAAEVGISPVYLARAFKAAVGQAPHQYVLARRLERAKALLRDTDLPIVDVAVSAGFSSQSHLSQWLQRKMGVSPGAYRRQSS
jgi:AraC family transcriptional regulator